MMQLVEQHIIQPSNSRWVAIDTAAFLSKNLYNAANYLVRQAYIFEKRFIPYAELHQLMKQNPDYCALSRKVSQWVLKQVGNDWQSFLQHGRCGKVILRNLLVAPIYRSTNRLPLDAIY